MEIGIGLGITRFPGWGVMNIGQLFASGEQGAWYDPSDMSTLFQDEAGTTPVTAVEQPVGRVLDKSGRGNHATQATTTKRPTLKQDENGCYYLSFDGVDDALQTGNIDFTSTDKMTVWAGAFKSDDTVATGYVAYSNGDDYNGFSVYVNSNRWVGYSSGTTSYAIAGDPLSIANTQNSVIAVSADQIAPYVRVRRDYQQVAASSAVQGGGGYGNRRLYIGALRGTSNYFNGRLYSLIVRGAQSNLSQIEAAERYIKQKMRLP